MGAAYLLPPSEGKARGGDGALTLRAAWKDAEMNRFGGALDPHRAIVIDALTKFVGTRRPRLHEAAFKVKGANLDAALAANHGVETAPLMPAITRYTGVLYDHLSYTTLRAPSRARFDADAIIMSGLFGLLAPRDLIPDYKLPMNVALPRLGGGGVAWWRPRLSPALNDAVAGRVVWDLLPALHRGAWDPDGNAARVMTARFIEISEAGERTINHWNKALKGALVRHLLPKHGAPGAARSFKHEGYAFDASRSDGDALAFSRRVE